jgi:hypothetical protein
MDKIVAVVLFVCVLMVFKTAALVLMRRLTKRMHVYN